MTYRLYCHKFSTVTFNARSDRFDPSGGISNSKWTVSWSSDTFNILSSSAKVLYPDPFAFSLRCHWTSNGETRYWGETNQRCAGKCFTKVLVCSMCLFPHRKYSHRDQFQATAMRSGNTEMRRGLHDWVSEAGTSQLQHGPGNAQRQWTVPCFTKTLYRLPRSWHHSLYPTSHRGFVQLLSFQAKPSEIPVSKPKLPWSLMKNFTFINKITEMLIFLTLPTTLCDVYGMLSCTKS